MYVYISLLYFLPINLFTYFVVLVLFCCCCVDFILFSINFFFFVVVIVVFFRFIVSLHYPRCLCKLPEKIYFALKTKEKKKRLVFSFPPLFFLLFFPLFFFFFFSVAVAVSFYMCHTITSIIVNVFYIFFISVYHNI